MKRKIISIFVVSIFLLTAINAVSKSTREKKENSQIIDEIKKQIEIGKNIKEKDFPIKYGTSDLDPEQLIWYPGKLVICGLLFITYTIAGILTGRTPWGIFTVAKGCGCSWAQVAP